MNEQNIYKNLKQLRKERGLTLSNLADKIGSDYQQLSRIERGKSRLTVDVLMRMAAALETPIDQLIKPNPSVKTAAELPAASGVCEVELGDILEKIEVALEEMQMTLRPQVKAHLASIIYRESLQSPHAGDFAIKIMKGLLS